MKGKIARVLIFSFFFWSNALVVSAQQYADKAYYLVDSLDVSMLSSYEKKLIDSSLTVFHNSKIDTVRAKTINSLVVYLPNDEVWSKYNNWLYYFVSKKVKDSSKTLLSEKEKKLYVNLKALALNNEGYRLSGKSKYKKALAVYKESLDVLEAIEDDYGKANVLNNMGAIYKNQGQIPEALDYYQQSLLIKRELGNKKGEAYTINNIAIIYRNLGDVSKALKYYLSSLTILEEISDRKGIAIVLNNIATIYNGQGDSENAKKYFERSLVIHKEMNNKNSIAVALSHLASIYRKKGDSNKALSYYEESLLINKEIGDKDAEATSLSNLASFYLENKKYELAHSYLKESLIIFNSVGDVEGQIETLNKLSEYYLIKGNLAEAKKRALKSMQLSKSLGFPSEIKKSAKQLAIVFEREKNWKEAYKIQQLYVKMHDSIKSKSIQESIFKQQVKYDIAKKEQEIKVLSAQNKALEKDKELQKSKLSKNRIVLAFISSALVFLSVLIVLIVKNNKRRKRIYKVLKKQKEEISIKNDEKTTMLKEIHHRVKNNLQTINSLLRLQAKEINDPEIKAKFKETQKRVISIAALHEKMYKSDNLQSIDVQHHIKSLVEDLIQTYSLGKEVILDVDIHPLSMGTKTLLPLGLIINEVVINSLKYAFTNLEKGKIILKLHQLDNGKFQLIIGDNGKGTESLNGSGFGTKLIKIFTKQLNGKVSFTEQPSVLYKIVFESIDDLNF